MFACACVRARVCDRVGGGGGAGGRKGLARLMLYESAWLRAVRESSASKGNPPPPAPPPTPTTTPCRRRPLLLCSTHTNTQTACTRFARYRPCPMLPTASACSPVVPFLHCEPSEPAAPAGPARHGMLVACCRLRAMRANSSTVKLVQFGTHVHAHSRSYQCGCASREKLWCGTVGTRKKATMGSKCNE